ncbi:MAG TPA: hypothetical protein VGM33_24525 [Baekduia sp.]
MSFLKNVLHDLIEKRLWPVAIALVVALIAVPIVLGGGSDAGSTGADVAATPTPAAGSAPANGAAVVSLQEQTAGGKIQRAGKIRDPFVQHHVAKTVTDAVTTTSGIADALSGGSSSGAGSGSTGGGSDTSTTPTSTTPANPTPKPDTTKKPDTTAADLYRVKLKFGEAGAERTYNNVARLTPLPSSDNPFFVYLGLKDDQKTAIFLVDADSVPTGDGTCKPSKANCAQIELKPGAMEYFDLQSGTAGVVQYQLQVVSVSKGKAASTASAARAHARESRAGREYLRQVVADDPTAVSAWDYSSKLGLLQERAPTATADVANVPAAVADAADGQDVEQTSTVLTVPAP